MLNLHQITSVTSGNKQKGTKASSLYQLLILLFITQTPHFIFHPNKTTMSKLSLALVTHISNTNPGSPLFN